MIKLHEDLYQGDSEDAVRESKQNNMDCIIYVGQELPHQLSHESSIPIIHIPLKDGKNPCKKVITALNIYLFLCAQCYQQKCLIACRQGISRSPTLAAAYYSLLSSMPFDYILEELKKINPRINPHPEFIESVRKSLEEVK